jgi:hypothetical protein
VHSGSAGVLSGLSGYSYFDEQILWIVHLKQAKAETEGADCVEDRLQNVVEPTCVRPPDEDNRHIQRVKCHWHDRHRHLVLPEDEVEYCNENAKL